jgi:hypothetical protein
MILCPFKTLHHAGFRNNQVGPVHTFLRKNICQSDKTIRLPLLQRYRPVHSPFESESVQFIPLLTGGYPFLPIDARFS